MATAQFVFTETASWRDLFSDVYCFQCTLDLDSLGDAVGESVSITIPGLQVGDMVIGVPSLSVSTAGILVTANVTASDVKAVSTLTSTGAIGAGETVTIGSTVYTYRATTLTSPPVANEVLIGANQTASHLNLLYALNPGSGGTAGTEYSLLTARNSAVDGVSSDGTHTLIKARVGGTSGNSIVTTETCANASWTSTVMASGACAVLMVRFQNETAGTLDLDACTLRVLIGRPNSNIFRGTNY